MRKTSFLLQGLSFLFFFSFFIYSCQESSSKPAQKPLEPPALKTAFADDFLMGVAVNARVIREKDTLALKTVLKEFNAISPENDMKWANIHPKIDSFSFGTADAYVALGNRNNMHVLGHTLVWHSQLAEYMNEMKDSLEMAAHLAHHITTIVSRYKGKIASWDVVNEALNEDGTLRETVFLDVLGARYIENAFTWAALADPDAQLIYNDYNLWKPEKRAGVVRLVKQLQANNVKIDAVGMQGHWNLTEPTLEEIEKSILAYHELGVQVLITELDITVLPNPWDLEGAEISQNFEGSATMNPYPEQLPDSVQHQLALRYQDIFKLFLKHRDKIDRITFWGVNDGGSWLNGWPIRGRTNYPLLFDRDYLPKSAYDSIMALKK